MAQRRALLHVIACAAKRIAEISDEQGKQAHRETA
jgi:hypothetical protein